ncbi:Chemotaxis protein methyltransferase Cher2 [Paraliobacillus sp. PM-2]|uniref:CheR family methyltransferase n=1 Tax=Paraliobacillus sp. PM-2 TaxID=1462524 RepID=UPI00061C14CA|nr:protein-glutamate O-methyltransferase CheR [Paraliobacillus sp. PM-2]CQR46690.1 Chemotaxis protein methyltransferase Cher2 [Paraliobacillus sp. PM-2]
MSDYQSFSQLIKKETGIDLSQYKEVQMKRRLTSLRDKKGYQDFNSFYKALTSDNVLMDEFLNKITINVSEFYRNSARWNVLEKKVIPQLLNKKEKLKIWSAACSTGDEPYTLAMMLSQYIDLSRVNILATDIDEKILERAKKGVYTERALKEVPEDLKKKFFVQQDSDYIIDEKLKKSITFKKHNLLSDPYPKGFDLIVCRNVLIYFTEKAKENIYYNFNASLHPQGVFFVGSTEQIFTPEKYGFKVLDTFFYQKIEKTYN